MAKARGGYNGGSSIIRANPVGYEEPQVKQKKDKHTFEYEEMLKKLAIIESEKLALRKMEVNGEDLIALGQKSSGWNTYKIEL